MYNLFKRLTPTLKRLKPFQELLLMDINDIFFKSCRNFTIHTNSLDVLMQIVTVVPYLYNQCMTLQTSPGESNCKCLERETCEWNMIKTGTGANIHTYINVLIRRTSLSLYANPTVNGMGSITWDSLHFLRTFCEVQIWLTEQEINGFDCLDKRMIYCNENVENCVVLEYLTAISAICEIQLGLCLNGLQNNRYIYI